MTPHQPLINARIASVTLLRNECDIAELFIKINARFLSTMYLVDHHSNDATAAIIQAMKRQGYPIQYVPWQGLEFQQSAAMTSICHQVARLDRFDYLLPLDADEFINESDLDAWQKITEIPSAGYGTLSIRNYCAINNAYSQTPAPLFSTMRPRALEPMPVRRLVMGNHFAKEATVTEGNHLALHPTLEVHPIELGVRLQHAPFRSIDQVIAKTIPAAAALRTKTNRMPGEGSHWETIARYIEQKNFDLSEAELANMGLFYPANRDINLNNRICFEEPGIGRADDCISMTQEARINVPRSLAGAIHLLEQQLAPSPASQ
jgi:hypothetical protein